MSEYFPKLKSCGKKIKIELDISIYAKRIRFINTAGVDISKFAKSIDLGSSKLETDK